MNYTCFWSFTSLPICYCTFFEFEPIFVLGGLMNNATFVLNNVNICFFVFINLSYFRLIVRKDVILNFENGILFLDLIGIFCREIVFIKGLL